MKRVIVLSSLVSVVLFAQTSLDILSPVQPALTPKEQKGVEISKKFINKNTKPIAGEKGAVTFIYGENMPSIVTAPLRITDISLEPGEVIKDIQLGDVVRWQVQPTTSGEGISEIHHIVVKPTDVGLETTLAIYTNKRSYYINLVSRRADYMPLVNFEYPEKTKQAWEAYYQAQAKKEEFNKLPNANPADKNSPARNLSELNFDYSILGKASWTPIRVYNDGVQTYIQIPKNMSFNEAPVIFVVDPDGKEALVNYRLKSDRFIVDKLFDKAIMVVGIGKHQEKVEITRAKSSVVIQQENNDAIKKLLGEEQ